MTFTTTQDIARAAAPTSGIIKNPGKPNKISGFYDRIPHRPSGGCWEWVGTKCRGGYGLFSYKGRAWVASRFSWFHANGTIPCGMYVCHHCDNPGCVNPKHLFLGTPKENNADMMRKNRWRGHDQNGEKNGYSKLTERQVLLIRNDIRPQREIAKEYGVSHSAIGLIKRRQRWGHVQ